MRGFLKNQSKPIKALCVLCACALLSGCTASVPMKQNRQLVTLPPVTSAFIAPSGDASDNITQTVQLFLPSPQGGQLILVPERILVSPTRHPAEYALRRLFSYAGTTQAAPLVAGEPLSLQPGSSVEISGGTATVNLAPSALALTSKDRYLAFRAIANTLSQWGDIRFVNVLVNGRQLGVDTTGNLPMGSISRTQNEDFTALWEAVNRQPQEEDSPFTGVATLYFPTAAGMGIIAEARSINFTGYSLPQMSRSLLEALSAGSTNHPGLPRLPDLVTLLVKDPVVEEQPGSTGRVIHLSFHESANESLIAAGIPRSLLMASLTYTLTTYLPYTSAIKVTIGNETINALVPAGLYEGANETILFENGLMQRSQFSHFLLDYCSLYFAGETGNLRKTLRTIPYYQVNNPRYLMQQLMIGPQNTDSVVGLSPALPAGVGDKDLLGITRQGDTILINLAEGFQAQSQGFNQQQELLLVYSMVNTLSELPGIAQTVFFISGSQQGTFCGQIDVAGSFLRNEGILR